eukprot:XP_001697711.1 predicted protein [Chlamydomonas reinhardtii]
MWVQEDGAVCALLAQAYTYMCKSGIRFCILTDYNASHLLRLGPRTAAAPSPRRGVVLDKLICDGHVGFVCGGCVDGEAAVVKFFGPDAHGLAVYRAESSAYAALAAHQGRALPRLLAAGTTRTLVPAEEDPDAWVPPPPPDRVFYLATSRVPGLTLHDLLEQQVWAGIYNPAPSSSGALMNAYKHARMAVPHFTPTATTAPRAEAPTRHAYLRRVIHPLPKLTC